MNKTTFGILAILFNGYGVPNFIQGDAKTGILKIVLNFVTCGIIGIINGIMGIILGIKVLQMTEEEYNAAYGSIDAGVPKMKAKEEAAE
ncbi:MAG: TM2 domain-containing protein [Clostridia bacterium]|nr:TM2 domain-containing protein [Clostridia bacterium]